MMVTGSNTTPMLRLAEPSFQVEGQLDSHLLIHLGISQISFAIYNAISNNMVAYGRYSLTSEDVFAEAVGILKLDEWTRQQFSQVRLLVQPNDFVLVPKDLFDPREISTYLNFHSFKSVSGSLLFDRMDQMGIVGVYHLPHSGLDAINKLYNNLTVFASPTPFLQLAMREYNKLKGDTMLVLFDGKLMHVMVINQTKLLYYNGFEVEAKQDVSYFTLAVCEQLSISPENANIVAWGSTDDFEERMTTINYYFKNVQPGERPLALKFAPSLSTLPVFSEYPLFASALCE